MLNCQRGIYGQEGDVPHPKLSNCDRRSFLRALCPEVHASCCTGFCPMSLTSRLHALVLVQPCSGSAAVAVMVLEDSRGRVCREAWCLLNQGVKLEKADECFGTWVCPGLE